MPPDSAERAWATTTDRRTSPRVSTGYLEDIAKAMMKLSNANVMAATATLIKATHASITANGAPSHAQLAGPVAEPIDLTCECVGECTPACGATSPRPATDDSDASSSATDTGTSDGNHGNGCTDSDDASADDARVARAVARAAARAAARVRGQRTSARLANKGK